MESKNGESLHDDVNGNGRLDFADVAAYFNNVAWIPQNEPVTYFDYNHNGRIDFFLDRKEREIRGKSLSAVSLLNHYFSRRIARIKNPKDYLLD